MPKRNNNKHLGSDFDDFLKKEDIYVEALILALKRAIFFQVEEEMEIKRIG